MAKIKDITGEVYGMLTVIEQADPPPNSRRSGSYWLCQCKCGNVIHRHGSDLRKGRDLRQSCGCLRQPMVKLHPNAVLGGIRIVEKVEGCSPKHVKWRCKCSLCHETVEIYASVLHKRPNRPHCGCLNKRKYQSGERAPIRFYEPGICPDVETCGPCQRACRAACFYSAEQIAAARVGYPERRIA